MKERNLEFYRGINEEQGHVDYYASFWDKNADREIRIAISTNPDLIRYNLKSLYTSLQNEGINIKDLVNAKPNIKNHMKYDRLPDEVFSMVKDIFSGIREEK